MALRISRRHFLGGAAVATGAAVLGNAPAALGQTVRELQVWHTEVEPQTVKTIQDTSIAEFERSSPASRSSSRRSAGATSTPSSSRRWPRAARPTSRSSTRS